MIRTRRVCRIKNIDIHRNIGFGVSNSLLQSVDDAGNPDVINISCSDNFKPTARIVTQVLFGVEKWRTYTGVDRGGIADKPLFVGDVEECT